MGSSFYYSWLFYVFLVLSAGLITLKYKFNNRSFIVFLLLYSFSLWLLSLYAYITPDYIVYEETFGELQYIDYPYIHRHMEQPYVFLANHVADYMQFREFFYAIVSFLLFNFILKCNNSQGLLFAFTIFGLYGAISGRQIISVLFFFIGFFYVFSKRAFFIGGLCFILSFFLHKSSIFSILALFMLVLPIRKRNITFYLCLIPCFIVLGKIVTSYISNNQLLFPGSIYFFKNEIPDEGSIWWKIISFSQKIISFGIILFELIFLYNRYSVLDKTYQALYKYLFFISFLSIIIFFVDLTGVLFTRCLGMTVFPMLILFPCVFDIYKYKIRRNFFVLICCFIYFLFTNIYILGISNSRA